MHYHYEWIQIRQAVEALLSSPQIKQMKQISRSTHNHRNDSLTTNGHELPRIGRMTDALFFSLQMKQTDYRLTALQDRQ
jgi:hypothetical protein